VHAAVDVALAVDLDGLEVPRDGAGRSDGLAHGGTGRAIVAAEDDAPAAIEVHGADPQRVPRPTGAEEGLDPAGDHRRRHPPGRQQRGHHRRGPHVPRPQGHARQRLRRGGTAAAGRGAALGA
jgi:hypothetical protein